MTSKCHAPTSPPRAASHSFWICLRHDISLLIAGSLFSALCAPCNAQSQALPDEQRAGALAKSDFLDPVLIHLRHKARNDTRLLTLLGDVQLATPSKAPNDYRPDAFSTFNPSTMAPIISINLDFMLKSSMLADIAGLLLTGRSDAGPLLHEIGFRYGQALAEAKREASALPRFEFFGNADISDPVLRTMTKRLAQEAFFGGVAWVVLHELAHHELGHAKAGSEYKACTDGDQEACARSRTMELDADKLAFKRIRDLGYGLAPLRAFLMAHEIGQEIRFRCDAEPLEIRSTHPSFGTRRKELERLYDVSKPPQGEMLIVLFGSRNARDEIEFVELWIPRDQNEGWLYALQVSGETTFLPYEWRDGQIHVYGRSADRLSELIVHQPERLTPDMTFRESALESHEVTETKTRGFQVDNAMGWGLSLGPVMAWDVLESSPRRLAGRVLREIEDRPEIRALAERVICEQLQEARMILIRHARGQLSTPEAEGQVKATKDYSAVRLREALGAAKYDRFSELFVASPVMKMGAETAFRHSQ